MRPSFLNDMAYSMGEVYAHVVDQILVNLASYFPYIRDGKEPKDLFNYQARMLAQMGKVNRETVQIIRAGLKDADAALVGCLEQSILEALKKEEPKLQKAAKQGILRGSGFIPPEVTPNQMQAFKSYYRQAANKLNLVNTVMLESTEAAYRHTVSDIVNRVSVTQRILNNTTGEVITGVSTWNEAVRHAVDQMVGNGLTGFIDHGGHRWRPETYAAMDIKSTLFNTAREAVFERNQEYGNDLYQVSSHNGARPLCYPWQGKVISASGWTGEVEDIDGEKVHVYAQSETSYGEPAGLFGINCGHYPMPFIPGFSSLKGSPQEPEENEKAYEQSQQQRKLERDLRQKRLDVEVLKAQGASDEEIKAAKAKADAASDRIDDFCAATGRTRRRNLEWTPVQATWPDDLGLQNMAKNDTINLPDTQIQRSLGAAARNYDIKAPDGEIYHYVEGTRVQNSEVFAGYGTRHPLKDEVADGLAQQCGGVPEKWQHAKGEGVINVNGDSVRAEVHWFQHEGIGQVKHKIKEWLE